MPVPPINSDCVARWRSDYIMPDGEVQSDRRTHNVGLLLREIAREEQRRCHPMPVAPVRRIGLERTYGIRDRGLARPTPDYDKVARAPLEHARIEAEEADSSDQGADAA